jgi:large subunit ribosomal protein L25
VSETALVVEAREAIGKGAARKLRAAGKIPAILYGRGRDSLPLALDPRALDRILRSSGANTLLDLTVEGHPEVKDTVALVKDLQRDPLRGSIVHADLYAVDLTRAVTVDVPIHLVGKARGLDFGGILEHTLREVALECLPRAIPESIEVEISHLEVGDVIHVRELTLPEGVTLVTDGDLGVVHIALPQAEPTPEEAAAAAATAEGAAAPAAAAAEGGEKKAD